jgi:PHD/YefM family antitoxin component YafN of YafNO toxin-antitoxin module
VDELESIDMTLEFTSDPELMAEIREAEAEVAAGQVYTVEEAQAALAERQGEQA